MKRYLVVILVMVFMLILVGCADTDNVGSIEARRICNFKKIYENVDVGIGHGDDIYVDLTTKVIYVRLWNRTASGFTPIYNADGTLKLWKGDYYVEGTNNLN